jgi:hypothetical protein
MPNIIRTEAEVIKDDDRLTIQEITDRDVLIDQALEAQEAAVEMLEALRELRDRRLFRATHKTFKEFCEEFFTLSVRHVHRMLEEDDLVRTYDLESGRAARSIKKIPKESREAVAVRAKALPGGATAVNVDKAWEVLEGEVIDRDPEAMRFKPAATLNNFDFNRAISLMQQAGDYLKGISDQPEGAHLPWQRVRAQLKDAIMSSRGSLSTVRCYLCSGAGCRLCKGTGWITQDMHERRPDEFVR